MRTGSGRPSGLPAPPGESPRTPGRPAAAASRRAHRHSIHRDRATHTSGTGTRRARPARWLWRRNQRPARRARPRPGCPLTGVGCFLAFHPCFPGRSVSNGAGQRSFGWAERAGRVPRSVPSGLLSRSPPRPAALRGGRPWSRPRSCRDTVGGVAARRWTGSWLSGATGSGDAGTFTGERFGLPEECSGSVASIGRRLLALLLDWLLCTLIALAFFHSRWWTLPIFAVETYLLTALTGFTVGKRVLGVRVVRLDGKPIGFVWSLVRTILLLAVVPSLITDRDLRGLHDRAANTIVIRS